MKRIEPKELELPGSSVYESLSYNVSMVNTDQFFELLTVKYTEIIIDASGMSYDEEQEIFDFLDEFESNEYYITKTKYIPTSNGVTAKIYIYLTNEEAITLLQLKWA